MVKKTVEVQEAPVDGRAQRGLENKQAIVEALIRLVSEGEMSPTADQVASEAGVALRTVFRHFADMQTLFLELRLATDQTLQAVYTAAAKGDTWQDQVLNLADRKVKVHEDLMPLLKASATHAHESDELMEAQVASATSQRKALAGFLPKKQAANKALVDALDWALSFESYQRLRQDQQLGQAAAKKLLRATLEALMKGL